MSASRLRLTLVLSGLALGALVLLTWTQEWIAIVLAAGDSGIAVSGQQAAPVLSALGLAALALSAALTIASRALRVVLGVLGALIGGLLTLTAGTALADPVAAAAGTITESTGISGTASLHELVARADPSVWPVLAVILGVLLAAHGIAVIATAARWPGPTAKYQTGATGDRAPGDAWDALSKGDDPTAR